MRRRVRSKQIIYFKRASRTNYLFDGGLIFTENLKYRGTRFLFSNLFLNSSQGKRLAMVAVFTALAVVANVFSIDLTPTQKIAFTYLVGFFAGTFFGGVIGFVIMFSGDVLGFLINAGGGVYWLPTGICTGLLAFLPGVIMNAVSFRFKGGVLLKAFMAALITYLCVTCFLGALSNYCYVKYVVYAGREYDKLFFVYLGGKIAFSSAVAWINYAFAIALIPVFNSAKGLKLKIE